MLPHSTWKFYAYSTSYRILQCKKHGLYEYHIQTVWVHSQTHRSAWDKIPPSAHMQNANIFLSATVPCYIAASLVIFIWILHLRFLPLSVCVIVSNTGRDLSPRSNRGRLPPPAARFWGLTLWDWSFYFCLVSAKRQGEKKEGGVGWRTRRGGGGETGRGKGASKERPPALCLRFPSVRKRGATNTDWGLWLMRAHECS